MVVVADKGGVETAICIKGRVGVDMEFTSEMDRLTGTSRVNDLIHGYGVVLANDGSFGQGRRGAAEADGQQHQYGCNHADDALVVLVLIHLG